MKLAAWPRAKKPRISLSRGERANSSDKLSQREAIDVGSTESSVSSSESEQEDVLRQNPTIE